MQLQQLMADVRPDEEEELRRLEGAAPAQEVSSSEERASEVIEPAQEVSSSEERASEVIDAQLAGQFWSPCTSSPGAPAPAPDSELYPSQGAVKAMLAAAAKARVAGDSAPADQAWDIFPQEKKSPIRGAPPYSLSFVS